MNFFQPCIFAHMSQGVEYIPYSPYIGEGGICMAHEKFTNNTYK